MWYNGFMPPRISRYWKKKLADKKQQIFDAFYEAYDLAPCNTLTLMKKEWKRSREKKYFELAFQAIPNSAQFIFSAFCNNYQINIMASANGTGKSFWATGQEFHAHLTGFRPFFCDIEKIIEHIVSTERTCDFDIVKRGKDFFFTYKSRENERYQGEINMEEVYQLWRTDIAPVTMARFLCRDIQHIGHTVIEKHVMAWCGPWIKRMKKNQQGVPTIYEFEFGDHECEMDVVSTIVPDMQMLEGWEGQYVGIDEPIPEAAWKATIRGVRDKAGQKVVGALTPIAEPWMFTQLQKKSMLTDNYISWLEVDYTVNQHNLADDYYENVKLFYGEDEAMARIYGQYKALLGLVIPMFTRKKHMKGFDTDGLAFYPPPEWIRFMSIDVHGLRKGQVVLYAALSPINQLVVYNELWEFPETVKELAKAILDFEAYERAKGAMLAPAWGSNPALESIYWAKIIDPRAVIPDLTSGGSTIAGQLEEYGVEDLDLGSKNLDLRVKLMREWFKKGRVIVSESCDRTLDELDTWRFRPEKVDTSKTVYNKPMDRDNDMMECLGRIIILDPIYIPPEARSRRSRIDVFGRQDTPSEKIARKTEEQLIETYGADQLGGFPGI